MASISINCLFTPQALSRPTRTWKISAKPRKVSGKTRNPRKTNLHREVELKSRGGDRPQPVSDAGGGEATTYTRLPPREDFSDVSLLSSSYLKFSEEVKLSESNVARVEEKIEVLGENDEEDKEEEAKNDDDDDDDIWGNYRRLDVFEGNSGSIDEDDYEDEVFEYSDETDVEKNESGRSGFKDGEALCFSGEEEEEEEDAIGVKEKGVPAVMRCFDRAKIYVKAGDGGNGVVAFRREKFVPFGGPSGGDGGRGGNVYVEVDGSMNSLLPFRKSVHFRGGRGDHGRGKMQSGAKGVDVVVKVAPGTVVRQAKEAVEEGEEEEEEKEVLLELLHPGQRALLLPGGRGGRGNASFKSGMNKVPRIAENGEEGPEM